MTEVIHSQDVVIGRTIDEEMDVARYKCRVYHMFSMICRSIYTDMDNYARSVSVGMPHVKLLYRAGDTYRVVIYVFPDGAQMKRFLEESSDANEIYNLTKKGKIL